MLGGLLVMGSLGVTLLRKCRLDHRKTIDSAFFVEHADRHSIEPWVEIEVHLNLEGGVPIGRQNNRLQRAGQRRSSLLTRNHRED